jgi:uncharacterized protein (DUF58 family)
VKPTLRTVLLFALGIPLGLIPSLIDPRLWTLWLAFVVCSIVALMVDALLSLPRRRLVVEAVPPDTLYIGSQDPLHLRLSAPGWSRPQWVYVLPELGERLHAQPAANLLVPTEEPVRAELPLVPSRRGEAEIHALWLRWDGPLGLVRRERRQALDLTVPVVPDIRAVRAAALSMSDHDPLAGLKADRFVGTGSEFESLAEYRQGLDHRAIDWKSSARHRKLLVRQYRVERNHQVILAFDTGRLMGEPLAGVPKLDAAINSGLLLSLYSLRAGDRVGIFAFDEQVRQYIKPAGGMQTIHRLQHQTAALEYSPNETNFTLGLTHLARQLKRRSLIVVLTDFVDTVTAELMLDNLSRLARRHVLIFVSMRDPAVAEMARQLPSEVLDMHHSVVAYDLLREREKVVLRLRRMGIHCIDAPPDAVGPALLNRYLDIKRRELI